MLRDSSRGRGSQICEMRFPIIPISGTVQAKIGWSELWVVVRCSYVWCGPQLDHRTGHCQMKLFQTRSPGRKLHQPNEGHLPKGPWAQNVSLQRPWAQPLSPQGPLGPKMFLFEGPWAQDVSRQGPLDPRCFSSRAFGPRCFSPRALGPKIFLFKGPWAQDVSLRGPLGPRCFSPRPVGPRYFSWGLLARARARGRGRGRGR